MPDQASADRLLGPTCWSEPHQERCVSRALVEPPLDLLAAGVERAEEIDEHLLGAVDVAQHYIGTGYIPHLRASAWKIRAPWIRRCSRLGAGKTGQGAIDMPD